ncbi:ATP-binding protein [Hyphomicrobium sp. ghe19]|uniref:ATP-binding protein n=1 Tax=Hyphomicrobium sp. ghe19 TaxID=2682968 RepID=UPI0013673F41|nr:Phytochrome-like protein cph1 [Hyphomicrobium sp. ghe19]
MNAPDTRKGVPIVTAKNVDLSNCDRELVQYPGAVQPHGAMLIVDEPEYIIRQASENCGDFIGRPAELLLGKSIEYVFGRNAPQMLDRLRRVSLENGPVHVTRESFAGSARGVNIFAHRCGGVLILELEMVASQPDTSSAQLYSDVRETIAALENTRGLQNFFDLAVDRIRAFTGYDRVMAYKFAEDGSGHVVAEAKRQNLEPYLGLHYPATDIPAPARRMFGLSWLRHLPDVDYVPVRLYPEFHPATHKPVDMSYAILRSVSVMYSSYLKNMGVKSTMVMPLMKNGQLWGLISAMHHRSPRQVPYEARMAAEFLSHMLSLLMGAKEDADGYNERLRMTAVTEQLVERLSREPDLHASLGTSDKSPNLLSQISAGGAAVVTQGQISAIGVTPPKRELEVLAAWFAEQNQTVFSTDRLPEIHPPSAAYKSLASGILAVRISLQSPEFLMWFRPEHIEVVKWAGDPKKPVKVSETDGELRLQPRSSFALWKESVTGRSEPWRSDEEEIAANLRQAISEVVLNRAQHIERMNRELADANVELDSFAYVASHDLKEPLRGVHLLASFLKRGLEGKLDEKGKQQLETILQLTRRMDDLIESLLQYSRTGRLELNLEIVDMDELLDEAIVDCRHAIGNQDVEIRRPRTLGKDTCDRVRVREIFSNLITNAKKYNDKPRRWIEIGVEDTVPRRYYVRDNGIGISEDARERIFEIFRRIHGKDEFGGGVGAGLTITRRAVERHSGKIWVESSPGEGSTFYFTLAPEGSA